MSCKPCFKDYEFGCNCNIHGSLFQIIRIFFMSVDNAESTEMWMV